MNYLSTENGDHILIGLDNLETNSFLTLIGLEGTQKDVLYKATDLVENTEAIVKFYPKELHSETTIFIDFSSGKQFIIQFVNKDFIHIVEADNYDEDFIPKIYIEDKSLEVFLERFTQEVEREKERTA